MASLPTPWLISALFAEPCHAAQVSVLFKLLYEASHFQRKISLHQQEIRRPAGVSDWKVLFLFLFLACTCSFVLLLRVLLRLNQVLQVLQVLVLGSTR
jgi:hypothetical protein